MKNLFSFTRWVGLAGTLGEMLWINNQAVGFKGGAYL